MADAFDAAFAEAWDPVPAAKPSTGDAFDAAFEAAWAPSQSNSGTQDAARLRGRAEGIGRAVASTVDAMAGDPIANAQAFGARMGDAWAQGDGVVDTAQRLGKEAVRAVSLGETLATVATGGPLGAPLRAAGADLLRATGLMAERDPDMAPAEQAFRDERAAQLADDEARDPVGTGVAKVATTAATMIPAAPAAARGVASVVSRGLDAAKKAMSGPAAKTVGQTVAGSISDVPVIKQLAQVSARYQANAAQAAAVQPAVERLAGMRQFGVPAAQQREFLAFLRTKYGADFMNDVAKAAGVSTKGI